MAELKSGFGTTYDFCPAGFAVPRVFGYLVDVEWRLEAGEVERAQASSVAAHKLALSVARVAVVVVGL